MTSSVVVESVGIRINQNGLHLSVENSTDESLQTLVALGKTKVGDNLRVNPDDLQTNLVRTITKPHSSDISGNKEGILISLRGFGKGIHSRIQGVGIARLEQSSQFRVDKLILDLRDERVHSIGGIGTLLHGDTTKGHRKQANQENKRAH